MESAAEAPGSWVGAAHPTQQYRPGHVEQVASSTPEYKIFDGGFNGQTEGINATAAIESGTTRSTAFYARGRDLPQLGIKIDLAPGRTKSFAAARGCEISNPGHRAASAGRRRRRAEQSLASALSDPDTGQFLKR
ncbi:hypothetical protein [Sphingomonas montana]|uniref:hypothetical protein n=1 Tax=Sphingomonas montana TaxID=1843236 RepID=UPI00101ADCB7|nr:hypothetical protein [Sphingomonas montana]